MAFADQLLEQAYHLLNKDGDHPNQASLRRAVSTAYYALFHLLIDEAVGNWGFAHQRSRIARTFTHKGMKKVCEEHIKGFYIGKEPPDGIPLKDVAQTFRDLQQKRETADYDSSYDWTKINAASWLDKTSVAFDNWRNVRTEIATQDFLLYLFMPSLQKNSGDSTANP
jgi:uncharacterized protein (UPF0332 family)